MPAIDLIKKQKRAIVGRHGEADDVKGFTQVLTTLLPLAALWYAAVLSTEISYWLTAAVTLLMSFFLLRVFVLMHECGHSSLFRPTRLNQVFGFVFGVLSGMPQYVWSQHHAYHHATNGNWAKYRGPLNTRTVEEYAAMTEEQQRRYRRACSIWSAPLGGFLYLLFNPRFTWLKGSLELVTHILKNKIAQPGLSMKAHAAGFVTPYWEDAKAYWHMFWNNVVLLSAWVLMSLFIGPELFFAVYLVSGSLAGGAGLVLFTIQHNFEHSLATDSAGWDRDTTAIRGTSFLVLPRWLNWFTANIAFHHIHHLSAKIPNYRLARCHEENRDLFSDVTRIRLSGVLPALEYILWDTREQRIISVAEYRQRIGAA